MTTKEQVVEEIERLAGERYPGRVTLFVNDSPHPHYHADEAPELTDVAKCYRESTTVDNKYLRDAFKAGFSAASAKYQELEIRNHELAVENAAYQESTKSQSGWVDKLEEQFSAYERLDKNYAFLHGFRAAIICLESLLEYPPTSPSISENPKIETQTDSLITDGMLNALSLSDREAKPVIEGEGNK